MASGYTRGKNPKSHGKRVLAFKSDGLGAHLHEEGGDSYNYRCPKCGHSEGGFRGIKSAENNLKDHMEERGHQ